MGVGALRAVFLDRDGVLNRAVIRGGKPYPPASLGELEIPPDVPGALAALKERGFLLLVVTNQPDVARGSQQRAVVESMHEALRAALPIDDFFVCYHDDKDVCDCRKPKPGLLLQAAAQVRFGAKLQLSDRGPLAGHRCRAGGRMLHDMDRSGLHGAGTAEAPSARVKSCLEAARWIVAEAGA